MDDAERLVAENVELRAQLEAYRLRELESLRQQLAETKAALEHYRDEAHRNANVGRQIAQEAQRELAVLKSRLQAKELLPNARPKLG